MTAGRDITVNVVVDAADALAALADLRSQIAAVATHRCECCGEVVSLAYMPRDGVSMPFVSWCHASSGMFTCANGPTMARVAGVELFMAEATP